MEEKGNKRHKPELLHQAMVHSVGLRVVHWARRGYGDGGHIYTQILVSEGHEGQNHGHRKDAGLGSLTHKICSKRPMSQGLIQVVNRIC